MGKSLLQPISAVLLSFFSFASQAANVTVTLDALESSWIYASGQPSSTSNENYSVGVCGAAESCSPGTDITRNWFVFDLSTVNNTITDATLRLYNPSLANGDSGDGFRSPDATELYSIYSYEGSVLDLRAEQGNGSYSDLGDGTLYGSIIVSADDNGSVLEIVLNSAAISDLNAATGEFAIGGVIETLSGQTALDEGLFLWSNGSNLTRELVVSVVPIPAAVWLFGSALAGLGWMRRKQTA